MHHSWIFYSSLNPVHDSRTETSTLDRTQLSTCWASKIPRTWYIGMVELIFANDNDTTFSITWSYMVGSTKKELMLWMDNGLWAISIQIFFCLFAYINQNMETEILMMTLRESPKWLTFYLKGAWKRTPNLMEIPQLAINSTLTVVLDKKSDDH